MRSRKMCGLFGAALVLGLIAGGCPVQPPQVEVSVSASATEVAEGDLVHFAAIIANCNDCLVDWESSAGGEVGHDPEQFDLTFPLAGTYSVSATAYDPDDNTRWARAVSVIMVTDKPDPVVVVTGDGNANGNENTNGNQNGNDNGNGNQNGNQNQNQNDNGNNNSNQNENGNDNVSGEFLGIGPVVGGVRSWGPLDWLLGDPPLTIDLAGTFTCNDDGGPTIKWLLGETVLAEGMTLSWKPGEAGDYTIAVQLTCGGETISREIVVHVQPQPVIPPLDITSVSFSTPRDGVGHPYHVGEETTITINTKNRGVINYLLAGSSVIGRIIDGDQNWEFDSATGIGQAILKFKWPMRVVSGESFFWPDNKNTGDDVTVVPTEVAD